MVRDDLWSWDAYWNFHEPLGSHSCSALKTDPIVQWIVASPCPVLSLIKPQLRTGSYGDMVSFVHSQVFHVLYIITSYNRLFRKCVISLKMAWPYSVPCRAWAEISLLELLELFTALFPVTNPLEPLHLPGPFSVKRFSSSGLQSQLEAFPATGFQCFPVLTSCVHNWGELCGIVFSSCLWGQ